MSLSLAVEALAFVHEASAFFGGHAVSASPSWCGVHSVGVFVSTFTIKSLSPSIQVFFLRRGLFFLGVSNSQDLSPPDIDFLAFSGRLLPFIPRIGVVHF